jgi:hypothetical protein
MNNGSKKDTFKRTMQQAQGHMSPSAQLFSKIIHIRAIEITSDTLAKTLLRPVAILAGSVAAVLVTLSTWLIAKHYGYQLSGSEPLVGFLIGWILGLLYDYTSLIFVSNKHP